MIKQLLNSAIAKYRYLSVARRSIICLCLRHRQIIDLLATDKSQYFAQSRPIIVYYYYYQIHSDVVIRMNSTNTTTVIYSLDLIILLIFNRIIRCLKDTKGYKTSPFHFQGETITYSLHI